MPCPGSIQLRRAALEHAPHGGHLRCSASSQATSCSAAALSTTETPAFDAYSAAVIALSDRFDDLSLSTSFAGILLAMIRSFLSTTGMASRACRKRTGRARARMRAPLKRAAGGAEGQYSRIWMAVLKRATGGMEVWK